MPNPYKETFRVVQLPCGLQGVNYSCYNNCNKGKKKNIKKIEKCYDLLKKSKEVRNDSNGKNK